MLTEEVTINHGQSRTDGKTLSFLNDISNTLKADLFGGRVVPAPANMADEVCEESLNPAKAPAHKWLILCSFLAVWLRKKKSLQKAHRFHHQLQPLLKQAERVKRGMKCLAPQTKVAARGSSFLLLLPAGLSAGPTHVLTPSLYRLVSDF